MESNELLTALANLETSLSGVESAKKQVENTVEAYSVLREQIAEYTKSLDAIQSSLQTITSILKERGDSLEDDAGEIIGILESKCNELLESYTKGLASANEVFFKETKTIAESFKKSTDEELIRFKESVQSLNDCIASLLVLRNRIEDTLTKIEELKRFLEASIKDLYALSSKIYERLSVVAETLEHALSGIQNAIESLELEQERGFASVRSDINELSGKLTIFGDNLKKENRVLKLIVFGNITLTIVMIVLLLLK